MTDEKIGGVTTRSLALEKAEVNPDFAKAIEDLPPILLNRMGTEPTQLSFDSHKYKRFICDIPYRDEHGKQEYLILPDGRLATVLTHRYQDIQLDDHGNTELKFEFDPRYDKYKGSPIPRVKFDGIKDT